MTSNPAAERKAHSIGLHGFGSGTIGKLLDSSASRSVAQGGIWCEGQRSMKRPLVSYFE